MTLSEKLTYSTVRLVCSNEQGRIILGTGFIMSLCRRGNENIPVIITNKHIVFGCNKFEFDFFLRKADDQPDDLNVNKITLNNTRWLNYPNKDIDLCCLPFATILKEAKQKGIDLFYIPIGLIDDYNHKPIIRRGITATHIKKKILWKE